jgi:hypothetical protein
VRQIRDDIAQRVDRLISELDAQESPEASRRR